MKKGVLFSVISMMIILTIFLMISARSNYLTGLDALSLKKIISDQIQKYADSIEKDVSKALSISSKRALVATTDYIITNNMFLDDAELRIKELMQNGTIYGEQMYLMIDNTLKVWEDNIVEKGNDMGINTSFEFVSFGVDMADAFNMGFNIEYNLNITGKSRDIRIDKNVDATLNVSIQDIEDPTYPLNTNGIIRRVIKKSPYEELTIYDNDTWYLDNLEDLIDNGYYIESETGASFIDRLEGRLTNLDGPGIKSIVNLEEFYISDVTIIQGETLVEYLYFNGVSNPGRAVSGLEQSWFLIDEELDGTETNAESFGVDQILI